tara:strand:- start:19043 stop:19468 length:426 start_codon:yes stop_codon:yes gene_type:complete
MANNLSLSINDIEVGQAVNFNIVISESDISKYAEISKDYSAIHVSREAAIAAGFRDRVAHGGLISSYFSAIVGVYLPGDSALLLQMENKFHHPAYPDDLLNIEGIVKFVHPELECIEILFRATSSNGKKIATGKWLVKVRT